MALASTRATAQIFSLPTAAAAPVVNRRPHRNHWPAGVIPPSRMASQRIARKIAAFDARNATANTRTAQVTAAPALPQPTAGWPFRMVTTADFALLGEDDRLHLEFYLAGIVSVRRSGVKHV